MDSHQKCCEFILEGRKKFDEPVGDIIKICSGKQLRSGPAFAESPNVKRKGLFIFSSDKTDPSRG